MTVNEFLEAYPFYLLFLIFNVVIIIIVFKVIISGKDDEDTDDDDDEGGVTYDDPILDLPPGVTLPKEPSELVPH